MQISELEEKITQYALKVADHEKNALLNKKEQQNLKKELEESQLYKAKYERLANYINYWVVKMGLKPLKYDVSRALIQF